MPPLLRLGFQFDLLNLVNKSQSSNCSEIDPSCRIDFGAKMLFVELGIARVSMGLGKVL